MCPAVALRVLTPSYISPPPSLSLPSVARWTCAHPLCFHAPSHHTSTAVHVRPWALCVPYHQACTRNILVEDSVFEKGHGCSIGSVGSGCVEDVVFRNITMRSQLCGCVIEAQSKRPSTCSPERANGGCSCVIVSDCDAVTAPIPHGACVRACGQANKIGSLLAVRVLTDRVWLPCDWNRCRVKSYSSGHVGGNSNYHS